MDAVAARAHASKATIYRCWPDKPELVAESLLNRFTDTPVPPETGSLRGDLLALMTQACTITNSADGDVITGVMTAATLNPQLAGTLHQCMYESKQVIYETILTRAVVRGEIASAERTPLLHEVAHAMILMRKMWTVDPLDEAFSEHVVDDVLIPLLTYGQSM
jgi:AcrR family transcriptional regulator